MHKEKKDSQPVSSTKESKSTKRSSKTIVTKTTYKRKKTKDVTASTQTGSTQTKKTTGQNNQTSNKIVSQMHNGSNHKITHLNNKKSEPNSEKKTTNKENENTKINENKNIQNKDIGQNKNKIVIENNRSDINKNEINKLENNKIEKTINKNDLEKDNEIKLLNIKIIDLENKLKEYVQLTDELQVKNKDEYKKNYDLNKMVKKLEEEIKLYKSKLKEEDDKIKQLNNNSKNIDELNKIIKKLEDENKSYLKTIKEDNDKIKQLNNNSKNIDELNKTIKKLEEENKSYKTKLKDEIDKKTQTNKNCNSNISIKESVKCKRNYDIEIRMESLNELLNGWDIKYGNDGMNKYINMRNKDILLIGIIGLKNRGKSYLLSKLLKENEYKKEDSNNLYLKYVINNQKNFNYGIIDTPGLGKYLKKDDKNKSIKELEKSNTQIDNFIINFILKKSNFIICVVGALEYNDQKLINKLKLKDEEYKKEYKQFKKIFIIHNLKELSTKDEVMNYINNVLLKSLTFNLSEKDGNLAQNVSKANFNTKYYIEKNTNQELEIYHLIMAKENTEAGDYYNESTYTFIIEQYNSFHLFIKFDMIKEIKEEIQFISKNILTKEIKSLDDFENSDNKIKLKNKFDFYHNSDEDINTDFSYLTLKPKYSYYKINNNSQLLIIIEMPGQIEQPKFVCGKKPKNGYYIMIFSGKKVINLPENIEEQKKAGSYFSNIDIGEFSETIKINVENFQLVSTKYKSESEKAGIYKYYFDIIKDSGTISSDD